MKAYACNPSTKEAGKGLLSYTQQVLASKPKQAEKAKQNHKLSVIKVSVYLPQLPNSVRTCKSILSEENHM